LKLFLIFILHHLLVGIWSKTGKLEFVRVRIRLSWFNSSSFPDWSSRVVKSGRRWRSSFCFGHKSLKKKSIKINFLAIHFFWFPLNFFDFPSNRKLTIRRRSKNLLKIFFQKTNCLLYSILFNFSSFGLFFSILNIFFYFSMVIKIFEIYLFLSRIKISSPLFSRPLHYFVVTEWRI